MTKEEEKIRKIEYAGRYSKEDIQQSDYFEWVWNVHPILRFLFFHIANEGNNSSSYASFKGAQDLAKGKLAGVPDNCCVYKGRMIWIELKRKGEDLSPSQKKLLPIWTETGVEWYMCDNFSDFKYLVEWIILGIESSRNLPNSYMGTLL